MQEFSKSFGGSMPAEEGGTDPGGSTPAPGQAATPEPAITSSAPPAQRGKKRKKDLILGAEEDLTNYSASVTGA